MTKPIGVLHVLAMGDYETVRAWLGDRELAHSPHISFALPTDDPLAVRAPDIVEGREWDVARVATYRNLDHVPAHVAVWVSIDPDVKGWTQGMFFLSPGHTFTYDNGKVTING